MTIFIWRFCIREAAETFSILINIKMPRESGQKIPKPGLEIKIFISGSPIASSKATYKCCI